MKPYYADESDALTIEHGTDAGYRQHHRAGEPACPSCVEANAVVRRARAALNALKAAS